MTSPSALQTARIKSALTGTLTGIGFGVLIGGLNFHRSNELGWGIEIGIASAVVFGVAFGLLMHEYQVKRLRLQQVADSERDEV